MRTGPRGPRRAETWGPAAERAPPRRVWALAGSELPLGGAFKLLLERKAPEVCPCPQRAHTQSGFFCVCACVYVRVRVCVCACWGRYI